MKRLAMILELTEEQHAKLIGLLGSFGLGHGLPQGQDHLAAAGDQPPHQQDPGPVAGPHASGLAKGNSRAAEAKAPVAEVLGLLNRLCDRRFQVTKYTTTFIQQRWREGFRLPDFEAAILNMRKLWGGDPEKRAWLRPETLFGNKMAGYVQAGKPVGSKTPTAVKRCPVCQTEANNSSSSCIQCHLDVADFGDPQKVEAHREWYKATKEAAHG